METKGVRRGVKLEVTKELGQEIREKLQEGYSVTDIAKMLNISRYTIYAWKRKYPWFADMLNIDREVLEMNTDAVERSYLERATGYFYEEETYKVEDGEKKLVEVKKKHVPAETKAAVYWLKVNRGEKWNIPKELNINQKNEMSAEEQTLLIMDTIKEAMGEKEE